MPELTQAPAHRGHKAGILAAGLAAWLLASSAPGQVPGASLPSVDQLQRPQDTPLPALPDRPAAPGFRLPDLPAQPARPSLSAGARVLARGFRFVGNTVFPVEELDAVAAPFVGRQLGNLELEDLRVRLTRHYVDAGYINSGAVLPDQDVTGGIVRFDIVEGRLSEITLGGAHRYSPAFLRERIALGAHPVLNVNRLQEHMQVLLQDPLIERISAELAPGTRPGEAVLRTEVTGASLFVGALTLSNERSPSVGADQGDGMLLVRNLFGRGEIFSLRPALSEGLRDVSAGASVPILPGGTTLSLRTQRTRSRIVEAPLDQLDIGGRSRSLELGITHPVVATPRRLVNASASLVRRRTESFFLGLPSPFIPGSPDGSTTIGVLRLGLDGVDRTPDRVIAGRIQISHGIDAFGATVNGPGIPDSRFTTLLAQAQWVRRMGKGGQLVARGELQRANDDLLGPEKYSLGGMDSVRGYRRDLLVRDNGWLGSLEYRHVAGRMPLAASDANQDTGTIQLIAFADVGRGWDHSGSGGNTRISSVGPGIRWEPLRGLDLQFHYGIALDKVTTPTRTLSDRGIHLRASLNRAF